MKRFVLSGLAVLAAATAFAAQAQPTPGGKCIYVRDLRNHTVGDDHTLYFNLAGRDVYRVTASNAWLKPGLLEASVDRFEQCATWIRVLLDALSRALPVTHPLCSPSPGSSALRDDPPAVRAALAARDGARCPLPHPRASRGRAVW